MSPSNSSPCAILDRSRYLKKMCHNCVDQEIKFKTRSNGLNKFCTLEEVCDLIKTRIALWIKYNSRLLHYSVHDMVENLDQAEGDDDDAEADDDETDKDADITEESAHDEL
ncbi:hypothetical protein CsSME_00028643 [Camellia sinensis var. sinensis]